MATIPKYKDVMERILKQSGLIAFERYNGAVGLSTIENSASVRTIEDSDILIGSDNMPSADFGYSDIQNLITSITVRYGIVTPTGDYSQSKYLYRMGATLPSGQDRYNFTLTDTIGGWSTYSWLLDNAYDSIGEERDFVIEADAIRDADTAERLARLIILLRYKPLAMVSLDCLYSMADLEIGDKVEINISNLPTALNSLIYMIVGQRLTLYANRKTGVSLELIELGAASVPAATEWTDTYSTGTEKEDRLATETGDLIQEVL